MLEKYALETSTKLAELLLPDFFFENQCPNICTIEGHCTLKKNLKKFDIALIYVLNKVTVQRTVFFEKKYFENQCPNIVIYNVTVQRTFDIFLAII